MKITSRYYEPTFCAITLAIIMMLMAMVGCGGDSAAPSATEIATNQLKANTWRISSVMVDGVDKTSMYTNMTLSFTSNSFSTTNGRVVWPASGTWTFTDNTAKKIKRNDNLEVTITEVSATALKLSLTWTTGTLGTGRNTSIAGNHVFSFIK
ncbi:MAG: hypothetical protein ACK5RG_11195 [Cyclobacteriaceae bacterium]|jgi:hypothetical protein|nr:hypothetical protein [Flammeovirgaceae bacterium]